MQRIKIVFSDVNGTLIHPFATDQRGEPIDSSGLILIDPDTNSYLDPRVIDRIKEVKAARIPFVPISSLRVGTYKKFASNIQPTSGVAEDGCVILDSDGEFDRNWLKNLEPYLGPADDVISGNHSWGELWEFQRKLASMRLETENIAIVDEGFIASFRITFPPEDSQAIEQDKETYLRSKGILLPESLKYSYNSTYRSLAVLPKQAGKANAVNFLAEIHDISMDEVAAMGDDLNDEEMLRNAGCVLTLGNAKDRIKNLVKSKGGVVVSDPRHLGTVSMLDSLLSMIRN